MLSKNLSDTSDVVLSNVMNSLIESTTISFVDKNETNPFSINLVSNNLLTNQTLCSEGRLLYDINI